MLLSQDPGSTIVSKESTYIKNVMSNNGDQLRARDRSSERKNIDLMVASNEYGSTRNDDNHGPLIPIDQGSDPILVDD